MIQFKFIKLYVTLTLNYSILEFNQNKTERTFSIIILHDQKGYMCSLSSLNLKNKRSKNKCGMFKCIDIFCSFILITNENTTDY